MGFSWRNTSPRKRAAMASASFIDPAQPVLADKPPSGLGWLHEIKHDGYRLQIHKNGDRVRLFTFTGRDWTARYPWVVEGALSLPADRAVIDAEAVACDDAGVAIFNRMVERVHDASVFAYAFDLLAVEGEDIRALPIEERKAKLDALLPKGIRHRKAHGIQFTDHHHGDGDLLFAQACLMGLEGHRVQAARFAVPLGPLHELDQN